MTTKTNFYVECNSSNKEVVLKLIREPEGTAMGAATTRKLHVAKPISDDDLVEVLTVLREHPSTVTHLKLAPSIANQTAPMRALLELIGANPDIRRLWLNVKPKDTGAFKAIADTLLACNDKLLALRFTNAPPRNYDEVFDTFWTMRENNCMRLQKVYLSSASDEVNVISAAVAHRLYGNVSERAETNTLTFRGIRMEGEVNDAMCAILRCRTSITTIQFCDCVLTKDTYAKLAAGLIRCHNVNEIIVHPSCTIKIHERRKVAPYFIRLLRQNKRISPAAHWNLFGSQTKSHNDYPRLARSVVARRFYH